MQSFYSSLLLSNPSGVSPGFYLLFLTAYIVVRVKALTVLGPAETFSTKATFVSSLPSRFLLSPDFWSMHISAYCFKPMMYCKMCFYILFNILVVLILNHCSEKSYSKPETIILTKSYSQDQPLSAVWWPPTISRTDISGSQCLNYLYYQCDLC